MSDNYNIDNDVVTHAVTSRVDTHNIIHKKETLSLHDGGGRGVQGAPGTTDYNELENKPDLTLKADVTYVDSQDETILQDAKDYADDKVSDLDAELATVAKTGSYDDLDDKPDIPSITGLATEGYVDGAVAPKANKTYVDTELDDKVDKEVGKVLSTNDFTTPEKTKLEGVEAGAEVNTINAGDNVSELNNDAGYLTYVDGMADNSGGYIPMFAPKTKEWSPSPIHYYVSGGPERVSVAEPVQIVDDTGWGEPLEVSVTGSTLSTSFVTKSTSSASKVMDFNWSAYDTTGASRMVGRINFVHVNPSAPAAQQMSIVQYHVLANGYPSMFLEVAGTQQLLIRRDEITMGATSSRVKIITGTGFPNGVVSAPVGSTYIDRNATNGAIEWKKATGTGNTGWVVSVGEKTYMVPSSALINGWKLLADGGFTITRTPNHVTYTSVAITGLDATDAMADSFFDLPTGYKHASYGNYPSLGVYLSGSTATTLRGDFRNLAATRSLASKIHSFSITLPCKESWPIS